MSINYKGAFYVVTAARVAALASAGFYFFLVPYQNDTQIDSVLAAVPSGCPVCVLLSGDDTELIRQVTRLSDSGYAYVNVVTGFQIDGEANFGIALADQVTRYNACKAIAPFKAVFGSYYVNENGVYNAAANPAMCANHAGVAWDYIMLNFYPLRWGLTDTQAAANLAAGLASARSFFATGCPIIPIEQCAGITTNSPGELRPIDGLLQAQHDLWVAAGLVPLSAIIYYGDATSPEDENLSTSSTLLAEAAAVS